MEYLEIAVNVDSCLVAENVAENAVVAEIVEDIVVDSGKAVFVVEYHEVIESFAVGLHLFEDQRTEAAVYLERFVDTDFSVVVVVVVVVVEKEVAWKFQEDFEVFAVEVDQSSVVAVKLLEAVVHFVDWQEACHELELLMQLPLTQAFEASFSDYLEDFVKKFLLKPVVVEQLDLMPSFVVEAAFDQLMD